MQTTEKDPTALKWTKDGKEFKPDDRRKVSKDGRSYELKIEKCNASDVGQYSAVAVDKSGESQASFSINVVTADRACVAGAVIAEDNAKGVLH